MGVLVSSQDFVAHFPLLEDTQVVLGILSPCVVCQFFYLTQTISLSFFILFLLVNFDKRFMQVCEDIMGQRS